MESTEDCIVWEPNFSIWVENGELQKYLLANLEDKNVLNMIVQVKDKMEPFCICRECSMWDDPQYDRGPLAL
jgi:hypothetical protein